MFCLVCVFSGETRRRPEALHMWSMKTSLMPKMPVIICLVLTSATDTWLSCTIMQIGHSRRWTQRKKKSSSNFSKRNMESTPTHPNNPTAFH
ncbi:hypothetical protein AB205_0005240 [Aquarana catesbeiana]|uniref:Uncharacterized protein n=1 Tax=Aquarana catesbeiana TaxID=8400 RepID=A0A2G9RGM0_AQUCT|nr:hypothetical protein AB205_0005240 [Aquarana catesbeiana]